MAEYCIRCGDKLVSKEDLATGICPKCWTEDDNDEELDAFIEAVKTKDFGEPNDSMFAMKYSDKFN